MMAPKTYSEVVKMDNLGPSCGCLKFTKYNIGINKLYCKMYLCVKSPKLICSVTHTAYVGDLGNEMMKVSLS